MGTEPLSRMNPASRPCPVPHGRPASSNALIGNAIPHASPSAGTAGLVSFNQRVRDQLRVVAECVEKAMRIRAVRRSLSSFLRDAAFGLDGFFFEKVSLRLNLLLGAFDQLLVFRRLRANGLQRLWRLQQLPCLTRFTAAAGGSAGAPTPFSSAAICCAL